MRAPYLSVFGHKERNQGFHQYTVGFPTIANDVPCSYFKQMTITTVYKQQRQLYMDKDWLEGRRYRTERYKYKKGPHPSPGRRSRPVAAMLPSGTLVLLVGLLFAAARGCPSRCLCYKTIVRCMYLRLTHVPRAPPNTTVLWVSSLLP